MSYDDSGTIDEPVQVELGDTESILEDVIHTIASAPNVPLSSTPRIDRDHVVALLKERAEFMAKTQREADEIVEAARVQAERMVQRTEVVRAAELRARQILEAGEADSRRLKNETEDFLDQRLGSFEILLDRLTRTVAQGRERLRIVGAAPEVPVQVDTTSGDGDGATFFDHAETDLY
jgi:cell division septum initiation protein DivIVA